MTIDECVAHIRKDFEAKYGDQLERLSININCGIEYPRKDRLSSIMEDREPTKEYPPPFLCYQMQVKLRCRGAQWGTTRELYTTIVLAATPERLFEKYIAECESEENQGLTFPKELL